MANKSDNAGQQSSARDIGLDVRKPTEDCDDVNCPFHGALPVRGMIIDGVVVSDAMEGTVAVRKDHKKFIPKYERFKSRSGKYYAHNPPCIDAEEGDRVKIAECRKLSKIVSFVVVEKRSE